MRRWTIRIPLGSACNKAYAPWTEWQVLGYYVAGPDEELEARIPWGWEQPDYDDRKWEKAVRGMEGATKGSRDYPDGCWFLARYLRWTAGSSVWPSSAVGKGSNARKGFPTGQKL